MSKIEVNQISSQCGSTLTIGQSGDTIQLACGATQTGFGRTGTVDWDTTAKTASFTAVSGNGYFVNTTSGAITVTMPATPSAGDIVGIKDYASTFAANNVTVARNGSNFDGVATDPVLNTNQLSVFFVYVDGTQGWKATQNDSGSYGASYLAATGGCVTTCGDYKIHTFTGPGTFCVTCGGNPSGSNTVDYLVVAGGASGGGQIGGGGGAGGARMSSGTASGCYTASPLGACVSALPVTATGYPIVVGGGGASAVETSPPTNFIRGNPGSVSSFSTITSAGGGGGGGNGCATPNPSNGIPGGSGGGAGLRAPFSGGTGNTPPVSPPQGNPGSPTANPSADAGAGGGGATAAGADSTGSNPGATAGAGGAGVTNAIRAACQSYAGGGGGGGRTDENAGGGAGGTGGGGRGAPYPGAPDVRTGEAGTVNTGSGGGGGGYNGSPLTGISGGGGSGIVIIRYRYQ